MKKDKKEHRLAFVIADDKVEAFFNNKTATLEEAVRKSKVHRKRLLERAKSYREI